MSEPNLPPSYDELVSHLKRAVLALDNSRRELKALKEKAHQPIAIISMACRFPGGANTLSAYWELVSKGKNAMSEIPDDRWVIDHFYDSDPGAPGKMYSRYGAFIDQPLTMFDCSLFGISMQEASVMDPQQRLLLEVAWESLENAGLLPEQVRGKNVGVFVGLSRHDFEDLLSKSMPLSAIGSSSRTSDAASRLAAVFGLEGPAYTIDADCSSALVAIHNACLSLRQGECEWAFAGGVNLILTPEHSIELCKARQLTPAQHCNPFDASASGYIRGEGCGLLILKPLAAAQRDKDPILAVIRGSAINQNGISPNREPSTSDAQQKLIRQALANAALQPADIDYLEAHGGSLVASDATEIQAAGAVYGQQRDAAHPLYIGTVKSNVGHLEAAAGIASVIKTVLALQKKQIPALLHLKDVNPLIDLDSIPAIMPKVVTEWPLHAGVARAAVSSLGLSGTNAHLIIEEAPLSPGNDSRPSLPPHGFKHEYCWGLPAQREEFTHQAAAEKNLRGTLSASELLNSLTEKQQRLYETRWYLSELTHADATQSSNPSSLKSPLNETPGVIAGASLQTTFVQIGQGNWLVVEPISMNLSAGSDEQLSLEFDALFNSLGAVLGILYYPRKEKGIEGATRVALHFLYFIQAVIRHSTKIPIWLVTKGVFRVDATPLDVWLTPLVGLRNSVLQEMVSLQLYHLDLDSNATEEENYQHLHEELTHSNPEFQIVYRQGRRYVARLKKIAQTPIPAPMPLRRNASYLVTGATNPLGRLITQWLIEQGARHLILIYPKTDKGGRPPCQMVGVTVEWVAADVTDSSEIRQVISRFISSKDEPPLDACWPPLRGIIHAAGELDNATLVHQNRARFTEVLLPKMAGAWYLHEFSKAFNATLDFFVLFSSTASLFGAPGESNLAAGNAFLDGLSSFRQQIGLPALSINWGPWEGVDTPIFSGEKQGLTPAEGLAILPWLIKENTRAQVGIFPGNWNMAAVLAHPFLKTFLSQLSVTAQTEKEGDPDLLALLASAAPEARQDLLNKFLGKIIQRLLKSGEQDFDDKKRFFEMGMDSLMTIEFHAHIRTALGSFLKLPITLLSDYPSLSTLTDYLLLQLFPPISADLLPKKEEEDFLQKEIFAMSLEELLKKVDALK